MTSRGLTAAVAAIVASLAFAAIALAAPRAGKWEGTTSQDGRAFSFKVTEEAVVKNIVFETKANCTATWGEKWHPEFVSRSYKGTKGTVKDGEIHIVREAPDQRYELHGKFPGNGKATGRIRWKFWKDAEGKPAKKRKDRVWTCKSNFDWSVKAPSK